MTGIEATRSYVGTEGFIPPEGPGTVQSDIYSLGKVLYEVSTGKDRHDYPELPTKLDETPSEHGILEFNEVVIKACRADPHARYSSAEKMHADLLLLQAGKSVKHLRKVERRLAVATRAGIIAAAVAVVAVGGLLYQQQQARHARHLLDAEKATHRAAELNQTLNQTDILRAEEWFQKDDRPNALPYLARVLRQDPNHRIAAQRLMAALSQHHYPRLAFKPLEHAGRITSAQFSRDGRWVLSAAADKTAWIWDASTGERVVGPFTHDKEINDAAFSPDGTKVVTGSEDETARIWDTRTGKPVTEPIKHPGGVWIARFSPDGERLVTSADRTVRIWNAYNAQPITAPMEHSNHVWATCFSPDGKFVLTASQDGAARIWDAGSGEVVWELKHGDDVFSAQFSPNGEFVATASYDKTARVWNRRTGQPVSPPLQHNDRITSAEFSPDGQQVATVSRDKTARLWDARTGQPIGAALKHNAQVCSAMFSPDGLRVVTASYDGTARLWDGRTGEALTEPFFHDAPAYYAEFHPDGQQVVTATIGTAVSVWNLGAVQSLPQVIHHNTTEDMYAGEFSSDLRKLLVSGGSGAQVWDVSTGKPLGKLLRHRGAINRAQFSPDGNWVATASDDRTARVWNAHTGEPQTPSLEHGHFVASARFSPDGQRVVTASSDKTARVWNPRTGLATSDPLHHKGPVESGQFSPNGRWLVTASHDHTAQLWDAGTGQPLLGPLRHDGPVWSAEFSPDSRWVVTASHDETAQVWDVLSGQRIGLPLRHNQKVSLARFSPNGKYVVTASARMARVWDSVTSRAVTIPLSHESELLDAQFSHDGQRVVSTSWDRTARLWDTLTGQPAASPLQHRGKVLSARFSRDGTFVLTAAEDRTARVWEMPSTPLPIPNWLPELAEAVAGQRFNSQGLLEKISPVEVLDLAHRLGASKRADYYSRWVKWFFSDDSNRAISPSSRITLAEYIQRLMEQNTVSAWQEAVRLCPTNALALARIARQTKDAPQADYLSRRAAGLAPNDPEVWTTRAKVLLVNTTAVGPERIVWDFGTEGIYEGWHKFRHIDNTKVQDGFLSFDITGSDPYFWVPLPALRGNHLSRFRVHLKNQTEGDSAQLFWTTVTKPIWDESRSLSFIIRPKDDDFTTYTVDLSAHPEWVKQTIVSLRLDPVSNVSTGHVAIDWISLADTGSTALNNILEASPEVEEALEAARRAIQLQPNDPETLALEAELLERTDRINEALQACSKAIQLAGTNANMAQLRSSALLHQSRLLKQMNRRAEAPSDSLIARNIQPREPETEPNLIDLSEYYNVGLAETRLQNILTTIWLL